MMVSTVSTEILGSTQTAAAQSRLRRLRPEPCLLGKLLVHLPESGAGVSAGGGPRLRARGHRLLHVLRHGSAGIVLASDATKHQVRLLLS